MEEGSWLKVCFPNVLKVAARGVLMVIPQMTVQRYFASEKVLSIRLFAAESINMTRLKEFQLARLPFRSLIPVISAYKLTLKLHSAIAQSGD